MIGIDSIITSMVEGVKGLVRLYAEETHKAKQKFTRLLDFIDVLLRMASKSLHCKDGREAGELRLNKNIFSPGWVQTDTTLAPPMKEVD